MHSWEAERRHELIFSASNSFETFYENVVLTVKSSAIHVTIPFIYNSREYSGCSKSILKDMCTCHYTENGAVRIRSERNYKMLRQHRWCKSHDMKWKKITYCYFQRTFGFIARYFFLSK